MEFVFTKAAPPRQSQIHRIATTTATQRLQLPATIVGAGRVRLRPSGAGADVQFYFAPSDPGAGVPLVVDSVVATQMGFSLPVNVAEDYDLTGADLWIVVIARAAGFLDMARSGIERTGQR